MRNTFRQKVRRPLLSAQVAMAAIEYAPVHYFRVSRYNGDDGFSLPRIRLRERRAAGARPLYWVMQRHLECVLYNRSSDGGSSGAVWKLLNQSGLGSTALQVNAAAMKAGYVKQEEYDMVINLFKQSALGLDPCSIGRIRSVTLLPMATAAAIARVFGRSVARCVLEARSRVLFMATLTICRPHLLPQLQLPPRLQPARARVVGAGRGAGGE